MRGVKSPSKRLNDDDLGAKYKSTFDMFANPNIIITGNNNQINK